MRIVPVEDQDLALVKKLLEEVNLSGAGIDQHFHHFLKLILDGELVAVAGLEVYDNVGLLRSLAVVPEYRHSGLGRGLTRAMINKARSLGLTQLYLVTETATDYFYRFGFRIIEWEQADPLLRQSEQFCSPRPKSAVCMYIKRRCQLCTFSFSSAGIALFSRKYLIVEQNAVLSSWRP